MADVESNASLAPWVTLRAGGPAEQLVFAHEVDDLTMAAIISQRAGVQLSILGLGSNVLPSDAGVPGLVVINATQQMEVDRAGVVVADTGCALQDVFLKSAQAGLDGLQFAVGIPGTLGGALTSNAGAYRSSISALVTDVEIVEGGVRRWEPASYLRFAYRDSVLRGEAGGVVVLRVKLALRRGDRKAIYAEAKDYQRQRIAKQPTPASAGSFFKNVNDADLASSLPKLGDSLKKAGVVPAGHLIEEAGLKGFRLGRAQIGSRHANFILNVGGATATEIRDLAEHTKDVVRRSFGVTLEEEVLYIGDWSHYRVPREC